MSEGVDLYPTFSKYNIKLGLNKCNTPSQNSETDRANSYTYTYRKNTYRRQNQHSRSSNRRVRTQKPSKIEEMPLLSWLRITVWFSLKQQKLDSYYRHWNRTMTCYLKRETVLTREKTLIPQNSDSIEEYSLSINEKSTPSWTCRHKLEKQKLLQKEIGDGERI